MNFAEKLFSRRKQAGLSQEDLAERLGVSRQAVSRWEMGRAMPDSPNLLQISMLFGVSADYLLHDEFESDRDLPAVRKTEDGLRKEHNRRTALVVLVGLHALAFFWGIMGWVVYNSILLTLGTMTFSLANVVGFEAGFRRQGRPDGGALRYRRVYYRSSVWLFSYFPIRMVLIAVIGLFPRPLPALVAEGVILAVYIAACALVTYALRPSAKGD